MNLNALHKISYGIYIVSAHRDGAINGQIANTVFQITSTPATLAVSINKDNYTHEFIGVCPACRKNKSRIPQGNREKGGIGNG